MEPASEGAPSGSKRKRTERDENQPASIMSYFCQKGDLSNCTKGDKRSGAEPLSLVIAGSRDLCGGLPPDRFCGDDGVMARAWRLLPNPEAVVKIIGGEATGADAVGKAWANKRGIPYVGKPANWKLHGRGAGLIRNGEMASEGDALLALWDGKSPGTRNMIKRMKDLGKPTWIYLYK